MSNSFRCLVARNIVTERVVQAVTQKACDWGPKLSVRAMWLQAVVRKLNPKEKETNSDEIDR